MSNGQPKNPLTQKILAQTQGLIEPGTTGSLTESILSRTARRPGLGPDERSFLEQAKGFLSVPVEALSPIGVLQRGGPLDVAIGTGTGRVLMESLANAVDLPQAIAQGIIGPDVQIPILSQSADFLRERADNANRELIQLINTGQIDEDKARDANRWGGLLGYTVAAVGLYKFIGKAPNSHFRVPLVQDGATGVAFGLLTTEGGVEQRGKAAVFELGAAGVIGAIIQPSVFSAAGYSRLRSFRHDKGRELVGGMSIVEDRATGTTTALLNANPVGAATNSYTPDNTISYIFNKTMSELEMLHQSAPAMGVLGRAADERAYAAALHLMKKNKYSHFAIEGVSDLENFLARMKAEFPELKAQTIVRGENKGDVLFGATGLNNTQMKMWRETGIFPGQKGVFHGATLTAKRVDKQRGLVWFDEQKHPLKISNVTWMNVGTPSTEAVPDDFLMRDFLNFWREGLERAAALRAERRGGPTVLANRHLPGNLDGAIIYADEMGQPSLSTIGDLEGRAVESLDPWPTKSFDEWIDEWAKDRGLLQPELLRDERGRFAGKAFKSPTGYEEFKGQAVEAAKKELKKLGDELLEPQERVAFKKVFDEYTAAAAEHADDLTYSAGGSGFDVHIQKDGGIVFRDKNSGAPVFYTDEAAARAGLQGAARQTQDFGTGSGLPTDMNPIGFGNGGGSPADFAPGEWLLEHSKSLRSPLTTREYYLLMSKPKFRPTLDFLQDIERITNLPVWSKIGLPLQRGLVQHNTHAIRYAGAADIAITSGIGSRRAASRIGDYYAQSVGLDPVARKAVQKAVKVSDANVRGSRQLDKLVTDLTNQARGTQIESYFDLYYGVIRPYQERIKIFDESAMGQFYRDIHGNDPTPEVMSFIQDHFRGALSLVDKDIRMVYAAAVHEGLRNLYIDPIVSKLMPMIRTNPMSGRAINPFGINELDAVVRADILRSIGKGNAQQGEMALDNVVKVLEEFTNALQGQPKAGVNVVSRMMSEIMNRMGFQSDPLLNRIMADVMLGNVYGALMGARPRIVMRDWFQVYWNLGTRLGFRDAREAQRRALSREGFEEALVEGAIDPRSRGLLGGAEVFDESIERLPLEKYDGESSHLGGALRWMMRRGRTGRRVSDKLLIPYSSQDEVLRSWAYHWQKIFTRTEIERAGGIRRILEDPKVQKKFLERGLPFYSQAEQKEFIRLLAGEGQEAALRNIGRLAAEETNFIYHAFNQPGWVQTSFGRLFGTFSTWPMNMIEMYGRRVLLRGTARQKAAFLARSGALLTAMSALSYATFTDLGNWMSPLEWFNYSGGIGVELAADAWMFSKSPWHNKPNAGKRMLKETSELMLPGFNLVTKDFWQSIKAVAATERPEMGIYAMMLGRPQELESNFFVSQILNPERVTPVLSKPNLDRAKAMEEFRITGAGLLNPIAPSIPSQMSEASRILSQTVSPLSVQPPASGQSVSGPLQPENLQAPVQ